MKRLNTNIYKNMLPENNDASTTRARSSSGQHNDMIQEGGNYGNETAATIQKAADHQISELTVDEISKAKVEHDIQVLAEISEEVYMSGWRLHFLTAGVWLALFLSTLETTIVSTSLVSIADAVGGFEMRDCKSRLLPCDISMVALLLLRCDTSKE
jgi:hypothetical protein